MPQSYCRLFLATPQCFDLPDLQRALAGAISGGDIACLLIGHEDADKLKEAAMALTAMAQQAGIAVLIDEDIDVALACGADGVQVAGSIQGYVEGREKLGADKIVGVFCGYDRHLAMSLGEAGADYVAFENALLVEESTGADLDTDDKAGEKAVENEKIANWWARVFEVPCVLLEPLDIKQARDAAARRIDFICPPQEMWTDEKTAQQTVQLFNAMIEDTQIETN